jgi:predicted glutamine amidotransferase
MFYLLLTFGMADNPNAAIEEMIALIESLASEAKIADPLTMTLGISDGQHLIVNRYASSGEAPTLYRTQSVEHLFGINPNLQHGVLSSLEDGDFELIVSEPIGDSTEEWDEIQNDTTLVI